jgi:hypothetical protein
MSAKAKSDGPEAKRDPQVVSSHSRRAKMALFSTELF